MFADSAMLVFFAVLFVIVPSETLDMTPLFKEYESPNTSTSTSNNIIISLTITEDQETEELSSTTGKQNQALSQDEHVPPITYTPDTIVSWKTTKVHSPVVTRITWLTLKPYLRLLTHSIGVTKKIKLPVNLFIPNNGELETSMPFTPSLINSEANTSIDIGF